jgi:hypothetical protein
VKGGCFGVKLAYGFYLLSFTVAISIILAEVGTDIVSI